MPIRRSSLQQPDDTDTVDAVAQPRYRVLADRITTLIRAGALARGARLDSVRETARANGVSVSTVVLAYQLLEDRGLVVPRPRSGYFVTPRARDSVRDATRDSVRQSTARSGRKPHARTPPALQVPDLSPASLADTFTPADTAAGIAIGPLADALLRAASDPGVVSFGASTADPALLPVGRMRQSLVRASQRAGASLGAYPSLPGPIALRAAIARRSISLGVDLAPDRIVVTNGCIDAISLCLRAVTRPGDVVALESPTYFCLLRLLDAMGLRAVELPTCPRNGLSLQALELAIETLGVKAVLSVPTLSNPLGATMPQRSRRALARLLARHDVPLIEDVIWNDLHPESEGRIAVRAHAGDDAGVMLCGAFSKTVAPGIRLGWVEAGRWWDSVRELKTTFSGAQTPVIEFAMADLLSQRGYEATMRRLRRTSGERMAEVRGLILETFPDGTRCSAPAGGYMLWVELPEHIDAMALYRRCLELRIHIAPGPMFTHTGKFRNCIRLLCGGPWGGRERNALVRVGSLARALARGA